jgi:tetratricopeptide (TPR) repeat protein
MIPPSLLRTTCLLSLALTVVAQAEEPAAREAQKIRNTLSAAQELQKNGNFEAATALVRRDLEPSLPTKATPQTRVRTDFALGYLYDQEASRRPADSKALLRRSEEYYRAVLKERPDHEAAAQNLAWVYRRLGEEDKAVSLLAGAVKNGPDKTGNLALQLGDLYSRQQTWDKALVSYTAAAAKSGSEVARRRVIRTYGHLPAQETAPLLATLPNWEPQAPGVAKMGYETLFRRAGQVPDAVAEKALFLWVDLLARRDSLSAADLEALPAEWRPATELRRWLEFLQDTPGGRPPSIGQSESIRRHVFARLALAVGGTHLRARNLEAAGVVWRLGLEAAPELRDYENIRRQYPGFYFIKPDLARELAFLYFQYAPSKADHTEIDRLAGLRQELFEAKGEAYEIGDLEAIQRLHATLGLIYEKMGVWGSALDSQNAQFQLDHALMLADQRERETGFHQPLPELSRMLADGQKKLNRPEEAGRNYLRAAEGYLDLDQLKPAGEMLQNAHSLEAPTEFEWQSRMQEVERTLQIRRRVAQAAGTAGGPPEAGHSPLSPDELERLAQELRGNRPPLPPLHQFKVFSDLAILAMGPGGATPLATQCANSALREGLDHLRTIVGASDVHRLEESTRLARKTGSGPAPRVEVSKTQPAQFNGKICQLFLPGEYSPMFVLVSQ